MSKVYYCLVLIYICFPISVYAQYNGIWQSEGYGHLIETDDNTMDLYQVTSISNIYDDTYQLSDGSIVNGNELEGEFSLDGEQLNLTLPGGTIIIFNELSELPALTQQSTDPQLNFDIFWQTYEDWCALFLISDVNWQLEYNYYSNLITDTTTDEELFEYMSQLLDNLNDGHSFLDPVNLAGYFDGGPSIGPLWDDYEYDMMDMIEDNYIDGGNYIFTNSEIISYGLIQDSIGYVAINSMDYYSDNGDENSDNVTLEGELDEVFTYLQNTKALIIDIRFNTGGYDSNARIIGNRLTEEMIPIYSKQVRNGGYTEFADSTVFYLEPSGVQYLDRPVVVLTSDGTLSAADVFALLAKEINCVTLIGEATYGALSDNYTKYLPNNWEFGISPERYKSVDNVDYEQLGVPPDIEIAGSMAAFNLGKDNILEVAIEQIFDLCNTTGVQKTDLQNSIQISPNPVVDKLVVNLDYTINKLVKWAVVNEEGKRVQSGFTQSNNFEIPLKKLPQGFYMVTLESEHGKITSKFIIK